MSTKTKPVRTANSYDRTLDKFIKDEVNRSKRGLLPAQLGPVVLKYSELLAELIVHERDTRRPDKDAEIWVAIGGEDIPGLAITMITAGIQAGLREYKPAKRKSKKKKPTAYKWYAYVGEALGFDKGVPALEAGLWARAFMTRLPMFNLTEDGMMEVRLDAPEIKALINETTNFLVNRKPQMLPMKNPPAWASAGDPVEADPDAKSSVSIVHLQAPDLVTHHPMVGAQFADDIAHRQGRNVTDALDWLQQTPYTINRPMLEFLKQEKRVLSEPPEPPKVWQKDKDGNKLSEKHYRARLNAWQREYAEFTAWHLMIEDAEILCDATQYPRDEFFNILKLDFRGRLVVLQRFAYQGDDATRSLYDVKHGAPIGEEGIRRLKAHVAARACGWPYRDHPKPDRLNLKQRIAFTERHLKRLCRIGDRVLAGKSLDSNALPEKDERYQFVRACIELAQAVRIGPSFVTTLPLVFDASCSGLQNIAAMLRSEDGKWANFYPSDEPHDLYQEVADWIARERPELWEGIEERCYRKIVKRPTMTEFYGSTLHGKAGQIFDELVDLIPKHQRDQATYKVAGKRAYALAKAVELAINNIVPSIVVYREFLEELCGHYLNANKSMSWNVPWLTIHNPYYFMDIVTVFRGRGKDRKRVNHCRGNTDKVHPDAIQSVAANFTHSSDAALMHAVALACRTEGIPLLPIHDCWSFLAPHAKRGNEIIREQMVWLHKNHDLLGDALRIAQRELPDVDLSYLEPKIKKGPFDLNHLPNSYFLIS